MVIYCSLVLLAAAAAFAVSESAVIESVNQDIIDPRHHHYLAIPDNDEKVKMIILYQPYCSGCIHLHTKNLPGVLQKLGPYIDFNPYPFGCANMWQDDGKWKFDCFEDENCHALKLHGCTIARLNEYNTTYAEPFNSCMMSKKWGGKGSTDMDATNCGKDLKISAARSIIDCAYSQEGDDILEYFGKKTKKIIGDGESCWIPRIFINGKEYEGEDDKIIDGICAAFANPPPECKK